MRAEIARQSGVVAAICTFLLSAPCAAQEAAANVTPEYQRELFSYEQAGRADPFRSLLNDADVGFRFEDLSLLGVVHHADAARSVAILAHAGRERRIQARIGERFGTLRIASIHPDRVEVVIEELGVARHETLRIEKKPPEEGAR